MKNSKTKKTKSGKQSPWIIKEAIQCRYYGKLRAVGPTSLPVNTHFKFTAVMLDTKCPATNGSVQTQTERSNTWWLCGPAAIWRFFYVCCQQLLLERHLLPASFYNTTTKYRLHNSQSTDCQPGGLLYGGELELSKWKIGECFWANL